MSQIPAGRKLTALTLLVGALLANSAAVQADLFNSEAPLAMTLTADFGLMGRERDKSQQYPAQLVMDGLDTPLQLEVRGNNRLKKTTCRYPPLRLVLDKKQVKDTIMTGQRRLKLAVQCDSSARYVDFLRTEYLVYKTLNLLTNKSFLVRWVDVTFQEADSGKQSSRPGFLIEARKQMEERLGMSRVEAHRVSPAQLDKQQAALTDLFQFMIGNTDYSILQGEISGEEKESCCHNARLIADGETPPFYPVAYDFDNTGVVDPAYATPNAGLKLTSIKKRRYRGLCEYMPELQQQIATFTARKGDILQLFSDDPILSKREKKAVVNYLGSFFDIIADDSKFDTYFTDRCR